MASNVKNPYRKKSSSTSARQNDVNVFDVGIYWFRNALRLHDNPSLHQACTQSSKLLCVYVIDPDCPFAQTQGRNVGVIRANFVVESLQELDDKLRRDLQQQQLRVLLGRPEQILPQLVEETQAQALFYEQEAAEPMRQLDARVLRAIRQQNKQLVVRNMDTHTLHPMEWYAAQTKDGIAPSTYGGFRKLFGRRAVPACIDTITEMTPGVDIDDGMDRVEIHNVPATDVLAELGYENIEQGLANRAKGGIDFAGGEDAALALLKKQMARTQWICTFEKPKTSPNALMCDTTGLSPYVKHGCLSARLFYHELSKVYANSKNPKSNSQPPVSLHGQLLWREYNTFMGYTTPNFDQMVGNPVARQIPWNDNERLVAAWRNSQTGYPFIDAIMTQLRQTGWIHHLARHAVACFLTRGDLWQSWEQGAAIFEELLIDADWSINNFNWQWLSCTAHFYQYFRCYSPVAFGKKTDPNGDYIRKWLPQFRNMPKAFVYEPWEAPLQVQHRVGVVIGKDYPYPMVDHKKASKLHMARMKEAYDAQKNGLPMRDATAYDSVVNPDYRFKNEERSPQSSRKRQRKD